MPLIRSGCYGEGKDLLLLAPVRYLTLAIQPVARHNNHTAQLKGNGVQWSR
jgi:hypothetical protein